MAKITRTTRATPAPAPAPATGIAAIATAAATPPATPASAKQPVVALRGGITAITLQGAKPYRTAAKHNQDWYAQVQAAGASPTVAALVQAGVPAHFIGYCVRRGYAVQV